MGEQHKLVLSAKVICCNNVVGSKYEHLIRHF